MENRVELGEGRRGGKRVRPIKEKNGGTSLFSSYLGL